MSSGKTKQKKKEGGEGKQRSQRATSNVFSMFDQSQIAEFKEAFTLIDANRDGFICGEDLQDIYSSLGRDLKESQSAEMLAEGNGPINFQVFLGMFGDKISGTDPEETILQAFHVLAGDDKGVIEKDLISELLTTQADRFSTAELNQMFQIAPIDASGKLDYKSLCYVVTHGSEEE